MQCDRVGKAEKKKIRVNLMECINSPPPPKLIPNKSTRKNLMKI